jgi:hypothetical protein
VTGPPDMPDIEGLRLPLQPLLDALPIDFVLARRNVVGPGVIAQAAPLLGVSPRTLHRYRHQGVDAWTADQLAIGAGWHPLLIWGQDWIDAVSHNGHVVTGEERAAYALSWPSP